MSVKREVSGRRSIQVEIEVPGRPEEVWQAIASGPGISAWFVPAEFEEHGGKPVAVTLDFGPGLESRSVVTDWDPPRRFVLTHFRGQPSAIVRVMAPVPGTAAEAWATLTSALGLKGVGAGQRWAVPAGSPELGGVVEHVSESPYGVLLRLERSGPGTAALGTIEFGDLVMVTLTFYMYGDHAAETVERETPRWQAWIQERFPMPNV